MGQTIPRALSYALFATALSGACPALAQTASAAGAGPRDGAESTSLDEIVVTARRREEGLQSVPVAISAYDGGALARAGVSSALGIARMTPGVTMTEFNIGEPQTYIRGVGSQTDSAASESSVTVSMDEVPIGRGGVAPAAFLDLARVEVLRGPQGTLYGKNASAGMMSYYANRPTDELSAIVEASAGRFDTYGGKAIVNLPLQPGVSLRVAAQYSDSGGYGRNVVSGEHLSGGERYAGRATLRAEGGPWTVLLSADYSHDDLDGDARHVVGGAFSNQALFNLLNTLQAGNSVWDSAASPGKFQRRRNYGLVGRVEYDAGWATITSLTGYRDNRYSLAADYGSVPATRFPFHVDDFVNESADQFSQELRFNSPGESPLQWVAGLFFYTDTTLRRERFEVLSRAPFPPQLGGDNTSFQDADSHSYAAFGQVTAPFADIWELTVGGRITRDSRHVFQQAIHNGPPGQGLGFPFFPGSAYAVPVKASFTKPTWRASLSVEPAEGKKFYLSYDRGYKSGTFTSQAQNRTQATFLVQPEKLDNFNLGMKTEWLDGRLRLNADAYYIDYKDLQVFEFGSTLNFVLANADATIKGLEVSAVAAPTRWLTVGGTTSYLDGQFDTNPVFAGAVLPYKGNRLSRAPRYKASMFAETRADVGGGELLGRLNYDYQSSFFYDPANGPASRQAAYGLLGGYLSWAREDGLKIALTADNLTNKRYSVHNIVFQGMGLRLFAPPRNYSVTVSKRF
ncbi:MAG: TonB-dependent receptor [Phenylobacterium sp.]|uniref:TonB-dependent receptor n=1 Tax=Phenylobacterium sp. TaxID=1871053 RepID=UPI002735A465|nr:TonB-dependent receptor [Phenylobacterium sp.]MDP3748625.1 TonB-dependent receptor [Phenylobacterium sp.]